MSAAHDADGTGRAQRGRDKVARNPIPIVAESVPRQRKPDWFRVTSPLSPEVDRLNEKEKKDKNKKERKKKNKNHNK
jgi:hypothetical protein